MCIRLSECWGGAWALPSMFSVARKREGISEEPASNLPSRSSLTKNTLTLILFYVWPKSIGKYCILFPNLTSIRTNICISRPWWVTWRIWSEELKARSRMETNTQSGKVSSLWSQFLIMWDLTAVLKQRHEPAHKMCWISCLSGWLTMMRTWRCCWNLATTIGWRLNVFGRYSKKCLRSSSLTSHIS